MAQRPTAIRVDAVSKDFRLPSEQRHTLKERVVNPRFDRDDNLFHALQDVSFDVAQGEFFGIVGRNGSGKSTLLKCMAGIYRLDRGSIAISGRLSTFIELGVGFNPDLAARDNIILNGIMLGLSPKQAAARVDDVIAFAELEDHVNLKLKNYSSGMQVRLAFSVMTQIEADVLLIDEVLAVGDASFQVKCFDVFRQLREAGKTIVLVTHDMSTVSRFCDRAMLIEDGRVIDIGDPETIGDRYLDLNFDRHLTSGEIGTEEPKTVDELIEAAPIEDHPDAEEEVEQPAMTIDGAVVIDAENRPVRAVRTGSQVVIVVDVTAHEDVTAPELIVELRDTENTVVFAASTTDAERLDDGDKRPSNEIRAGERWRMSLWVDLLLRQDRFRVRAVVKDRNGRVLDRPGDLATVEVTSVQPIGGVANLPHRVSWGAAHIAREAPLEVRPAGVND